jgi:L-phenylalanine/L-methionine N-acetyltransferase
MSGTSCAAVRRYRLRRGRRNRLSDLTVRRGEPEDYEDVYRVYSSPNALAGTIGVPFSSPQEVREELARGSDGSFPLVACAGEEVVGQLTLSVYMNPRRGTRDTSE